MLFHVQFCCLLTYIQISQEACHVIWNSHLFKDFPQFVVIHTVKGCGVVNKAEVDVFLELFCFFDNPTDVDNLISGSSAFLNPAWTAGSLQFTYYWSLAWRILSITFLKKVRWVQLSGILNILWHCLSLGLKWKLIFSSPGATAASSKFAGILSATLSQHHLLGFEVA